MGETDVSTGSAASAALLNLICRKIRQDGPLSFSHFQDLALYHPQYGYYTRGAGIGRAGGDFWTAPEMDPAFGELIGVQVAEMSRLMGEPIDFALLEVGGGTGRLARTVLDAWKRDHHPLYRPGVYRILEKSPALRASQRRQLEEHRQVVQVGRGLLEEAAPALTPVSCGVVLLNEVLDALPVDRVRGSAAGLMEVRVDLEGDGLVEREVPAAAGLEALLKRRLPAGTPSLPPGQEAELCPLLGPFLAEVAGLIGRGYLLVVDYGHEARALFHPLRRRGTLMAYRRHRASEDLLASVGEQDLTAHVDLSALRQEAMACGFQVAGCTSQARFLLALGLGERIEALETSPMSDTDKVRRRLALASLVRPGGMGDLFHVWIGAREAPHHLKGLSDPFPQGPA